MAEIDEVLISNVDTGKNCALGKADIRILILALAKNQEYIFREGGFFHSPVEPGFEIIIRSNASVLKLGLHSDCSAIVGITRTGESGELNSEHRIFVIAIEERTTIRNVIALLEAARK